jgi:leucyl/phenylalanyl-tRNA--protein transferase
MNEASRKNRSPRIPSGSSKFPAVRYADEHGLLAVGGKLEPEWLLDAYSHGIFPWPFSDGMLAWWSPDPRAVLELDRLHVARRLARTCRSGRFEVTCDQDFSGVIAGCGSAPDRMGETWITPPMLAAYEQMHRLGHAHSIEVWYEGKLAGGVYGISLGGMFAAESMFHLVRDASKVALVRMVHHLRCRGYALLDIQQLTPHTQRFGAHEIPRKRYLARLWEALELDVSFGQRLEDLPATGNDPP